MENDLLREMAVTLANETSDPYLKGLMGSLFDNLSPEEVLDELRLYNEGERPQWIFTLNNERC